MRQLFIETPAGQGDEARRIAKGCGAVNPHLIPSGREGAGDLLIVQAPNERLDALIGQLQDAIEELRITWHPRGVVALFPPPDQAPDQVAEVSTRSPIEIFLGGLQSVGSWNAFLGYAAAAGAVVWIGLFTEKIYLLTAAMLIAPYAGPAMNAAIATARGDARLFGRSVLRYFSALGLSVVVAFALTRLFGQDIATPLMIETSFVSSAAALLPLVAGAAGALNLCQSERSSLVSGAATGMLVAASLAPQAGLIGMGAALGEWDLVTSASFVLLLQLVGINLAGAAVFWAFGLRPRGVRYARGRRSFRALAGAASLAALGALLAVQLHEPPALQQSTRAQRAAAEVRDVVQASGLAHLVEANVRFTRADIPDQNTLLASVFVQVRTGREGPRVKDELEMRIARRLADRFQVRPLVDVTPLSPHQAAVREP